MAEDFENKRKEAEAFAKSIEASRKSMEAFQKAAGGAFASLFELSTSDFFKEIERSPEVMKQLTDKARELELVLIKNKNQMNEIFQGSVKDNFSTIDELKERIRDLPIDDTNLEFIKMRKNLIDSLKNVQNIEDVDIADWMSKNGEEAHNFVNQVLGANHEFKDMLSNIASTEAGLQAVNKELQKSTELSLSLSKAFGKFVDRKFSVEKITSAMIDFDKVINKATRETGILFDTLSNQAAFTNLTINTAAYGKSVGETAEFMGNLGDKLNSTNFDLLAKAAEDTKTFEYAIGLSNQATQELTYNFMRMGKSTDQVKKFVQDAATSSGMLGLNTKKVVEDVSRNFPKFRQYGFQGGVESLTKMVQTAQKLRLNVDEIFNVAQRARSIEGAMEMAAELQLAGGSFAQIDPMQLLAAARKSPAELTKILGQMGNDIGKFDEKTGEVKFDPVDADRLEMVSKATGLSVDSLMDKITKSKREAKKENLLGSLFGQLDDEQKEFVQQFTEIGENGQITMTGELKGLSVDELKNMNKEDIAKRMAQAKDNQKSLEERAKQNQAFTEALSNLSQVLLNFFTIFQPILDVLTSVITTLTKFATEYKVVTYALIGGFLLFKFTVLRNMIGGFLSGFTSLLSPKNLMSKVGGLFGKGGGGGITQNASVPGQVNGGGFLSGMDPEKIKAIGSAAKEASVGILALGGAILLIGAGIAVASLGLSKLVESFQTLTGGQIVGAVLAISVVMGGFVAIIYAMVPAITALGGTAAVTAGPLIALGVAFLGIGAGIGIAAAGLSLLVSSMSVLPPVISSIAEGIVTVVTGFGNLAMSLAPLAPSLLLLGPAFIAAAAGLTAFTFAATAFGISSIIFGSAFGELQNLASLGPMLSEGGKGINAMATGVEKLSAALSSISDDTLDKLKAIGESIGDAAALTAAVGAITAATGAGGKGGTPQTFQIEVIVKNEDGRTIQKRIIKDTELLK